VCPSIEWASLIIVNIPPSLLALASLLAAMRLRRPLEHVEGQVNELANGARGAPHTDDRGARWH
jgi:hypothetical protein